MNKAEIPKFKNSKVKAGRKTFIKEYDLQNTVELYI